jgi:hypothetical protein
VLLDTVHAPDTFTKSNWAANDKMFRQDFNRVDAKRRTGLDHRKKQFADPSYKEQQYPNRLNFYATPPTADITLEQFEQWAIDRLRSEIRHSSPLRIKADLFGV